MKLHLFLFGISTGKLDLDKKIIDASKIFKDAKSIAKSEIEGLHCIEIDEPLKKDIKLIKVEDKNKAIINIANDQKAKAIGKSGINIRLASMLTKYTIELNEVEGITDRTGGSTDNKEQAKTTDTTALADLFK